MRIFVIINIMLWVLAGLVGGAVASPVKVKHVGSIYADAEGTPLSQPADAEYIDDMLVVADSGSRKLVFYKFMDDSIKAVKSISLPDLIPIMVQPAAGGRLYVLDGRERQIFEVDQNGKVSGTFEPTGLQENRRVVPRSIKTGYDNSLLVLDVFSERVMTFDPQGKFIRQLPFPAQYKAITDVTMDSEGNIYLLDAAEAVIYKAQAGAEEFVPLTPPMKDRMNFPTNLSCDKQGNLYLVDKYGGGLDVVTVGGDYLGRKLSMGWRDSFLYYPSQVSVSSTGDMFVADSGNHRVQHFRLDE